MRPRQLALAATIAVTASLAAAPAAPAATTCATKGSTLAAGPSARVFVVKSRGIRRVYGCSTVANKLRSLGTAGGEGIDTTLIALRGVRVAYVRTSCGDTGCQQSVLVHDIQAGKAVSAALSTPGDVDQKVTDLVLGTNGTVAWIADERAGDGVVTQRYVSKRAPGAFTGIPVVPIATGLDISAGTLALGGVVLYWIQGLVPRAGVIT